MDDSVELGRGRKTLAVVALLVFVLSFTPRPVNLDWATFFQQLAALMRGAPACILY